MVWSLAEYKFLPQINLQDGVIHEKSSLKLQNVSKTSRRIKVYVHYTSD